MPENLEVVVSRDAETTGTGSCVALRWFDPL